jgi:hypothetical protein
MAAREVLEEFTGFVERTEAGVAYVTLTAPTGETLWGEYPAAKLEAKGIRERRRFICRTVSVGDCVGIELTAVPDCEVTEPGDSSSSF